MIRLATHQWKKIAPVLEEARPKRRRDMRSIRLTMDAILWVIRVGCSWSDIPRRFPAPATCYKLYKDLLDSGGWDKILFLLAQDLKNSEKINVLPCFENGKFNPDCSRKKIYALLDKYHQEKDWKWLTLFLFLNPYADEKESPKEAVQTIVADKVIPKNQKSPVTYKLKTVSVHSGRVSVK